MFKKWSYKLDKDIRYRKNRKGEYILEFEFPSIDYDIWRKPTKSDIRAKIVLIDERINRIKTKYYSSDSHTESIELMIESELYGKDITETEREYKQRIHSCLKDFTSTRKLLSKFTDKKWLKEYEANRK